MDSLAAYGSDDERPSRDDSRGSSGSSCGEDAERQRRPRRRQDDTNYDHVTMDMSEESDPETASPERDTRKSSHDPETRQRNSNDERSRDREPKQRDRSDDAHSGSSDKRDKDRDRRRDRDGRSRHDRKRPEDERARERRRDRSRSNERTSGSSRRRSSSGDRDSSSRNRRNRHSDSSRRSDSRERRANRRSPGEDGSPADLEYRPHYKVSKRLHAIDKMGLQIKTPDGSTATAQTLMRQTFVDQVEKVKNDTGIELPKYYNPATVNPMKYANQIQKRKLLWGNKAKEEEAQTSAVSSDGKANKWQGTKFAQDYDGKVASKFMRLMGIKNAETPAAPGTSSDSVKKQEEMFEAMQAQYDVARATTHTMRGVGLGFSSHKSF